MSTSHPQPSNDSHAAPPALIVGVRGAVWLSAEGEVEEISHRLAAGRIEGGVRPLVCYLPLAAKRLKIEIFPAFDLLELFAFVYPARFCLPTPGGLAEALGLPLPGTLEAEAECLMAAAENLFDRLAAIAEPNVAAVARFMARGGWPWGGAVLAALGEGGEAPHSKSLTAGMHVWERLPEWQEQPPKPPPGTFPVEPLEARAQLAKLLGAGSAGLEDRPQQMDYAAGVSAAFMPRDHENQPRFVLAEAGTGVGKTLGYIAPASVWAEKNEGPVWVSTFTRNLQRQLDAELDRLYPEPAEKRKKVVIRKGRENYFCLLNFEEALRRPGAERDATALGLIARWALATRDGDMEGGDFPAWLTGIFGRSRTQGLTDTRGECVYSLCGHYAKCFIERCQRRARHASLVVANHALVMTQAAYGAMDEGAAPRRYVFDEGHHLFGAADSAFSAHLSGMETADLRRWLVGGEGGGRSRSRGLRARIGDLVSGDEEASTALDAALRAARALPGQGWRQRIKEGKSRGPAEAFLALVHRQVYARAGQSDRSYSLECGVNDPVPGFLEAAVGLEAALAGLDAPLRKLSAVLADLLDRDSSDLDGSGRARIEGARRGIERRGVGQIGVWRAMLGDLQGVAPTEFVDWLGVERRDGYDLDVGLHRHWVDPSRPFAEVVAAPAQGLLVTSATLRDTSGDGEADWAAAEAFSGAAHLASPVVRVAEPSPFDYAARTLVMVVTDVERNDPRQVAAACRELFLASGGGGLGLFTAIRRLRAVHQHIAGDMEEAGLHLLAQHVDGFDPGALVDIFRAEENTCLLGTDAIRDGIDVPGRSLRLIVFDRVPWPRPDILHKARRAAFGGSAYDDMLTRGKLKQAYGRLIRRADDGGVFVILDRRLPSRMLSAFPQGVKIRRLGLKDVVAETRAFLAGLFADLPTA
jgi:ATP-dependent DNA helicase DinG